VVVAALVVGAMVLGVVTLQAMVAESSFRMQDLARRGAELRQDQGELRLKVAELSSPGRIAKEARRLGLHLPEDVQTLRVRGATP
jgi:cell division protein FtsL